MKNKLSIYLVLIGLGSYSCMDISVFYQMEHITKINNIKKYMGATEIRPPMIVMVVSKVRGGPNYESIHHWSVDVGGLIQCHNCC